MHVDVEALTLLALGQPLDASAMEQDLAHVQTCASCTAELAELRRVVELGRSGAVLTVPDPRVWVSIREGLAARAEGRAEPRGHARLVPVLQEWSSASGEAELATDRKGRRLLSVSLRADLPTAGVRQAWLVHRDDPAQRQTLGILDGRDGLWTVEHAIDLREYPLLEISQQSLGSTEHSGQTIVRGELVLVG